ncbi:hypothetical protein [Amycolatopsis cihanbeyliensis]|uniref:Uncharacterized protein n=1 Tax=Amycolatopsis cihanbeyliensis TaxID=1128664 RepID=A0A542DI71_AMYCI|nr:hypothetical protein [Amycolatopsis cihanbeyliensis]TQJ02789.1 hypothetical protein FB471_2534 [Amycolatopsis cihanbeyliensis]
MTGHLAREAALAQVNPLTEFPLLGFAVELLDGLLADLGLPFWFRSFVELVALGVLGYHLIGLVLCGLIPRLGRLLAEPGRRLVDLLRTLLLLPELALSRALRARHRRPPGAVYFYGALVLGLGDGLHHLVRVVLAGARALATAPRVLLLILLVGMFLWWNDGSCVGANPSPCVSPVQQWTSAVTRSAETK